MTRPPKASDITDEQLLDAVRVCRGRNGVPRWATIWDVQEHLAQFPPKVVRAKAASAIRRRLIDGCTCGCRGDLEIIEPRPVENTEPRYTVTASAITGRK